MSDLINTSDRYHLMGVRTVERDDNRDLKAGNNPDSQHVAGEVVYTTNDKDEANQISKNGGFTREGEGWTAVAGWRDTQATASAGADAPSPLKKGG